MGDGVEAAVPLDSGVWRQIGEGWGQQVIFTALGQCAEFLSVLWVTGMATGMRKLVPIASRRTLLEQVKEERQWETSKSG